MNGEIESLDIDEIIAQVDQAFESVKRPKMFIRGTCFCEECKEHEEAMQAFALPDLPLEKLDNPGWDPICFASNEAIAYLMPGLIRTLLNHTDEYITQFLFHLEIDDRVTWFTKTQRQTLIRCLDFLIMNRADDLDNNFAVDDVIRIREKLEQET